MRPRPYQGAIEREKTIVRQAQINPAPAVRDAGKPLLVIGTGASCRRWLRPQAVDQLQDFREHLPRQGNLGHLERNITAVADDLCADLDHILPQRDEQSVLDDQGIGPNGVENHVAAGRHATKVLGDLRAGGTEMGKVARRRKVRCQEGDEGMPGDKRIAVKHGQPKSDSMSRAACKTRSMTRVSALTE